MSFADELQKLADLRASGALSPEEFQQAKIKLLNDHSNAPQDDLADSKFHRELERIDREWELKRENYYVNGRHGRRYIPSTAGSAMGIVAVIGFAMLLLTIAAGLTADRGVYIGEGQHRVRVNVGGPSHGPPPEVGGAIAVVGILVLLLGGGAAIHSMSKASNYETASTNYEARRAELLRERGELPPESNEEKDIHFPEDGKGGPDIRFH